MCTNLLILNVSGCMGQCVSCLYSVYIGVVSTDVVFGWYRMDEAKIHEIKQGAYIMAQCSTYRMYLNENNKLKAGTHGPC